MIYKIVEVNILFEMVSPAVRHEPFIDCMDLPNCPRIKPRFWEELLEKIISTDLNIASPQAKTSQLMKRQGAPIFVMQYPADPRLPPICRRHSNARSRMSRPKMRITPSPWA